MDNLMNSTTTNSSNVSTFLDDDDDLSYRKLLKVIYDYMVVFVLVLIMLAMGADITFNQVWHHIRRPVGVAIGMFCQFCVMPFIGFVLSKSLSLYGAYAVGTLLVSCSPGGAVSNIFTYYIDGDVSLSVTMTSVSTLIDFGFMPLNFWIYGHFIELNNLVIPYKHMALSMVFVTVPALVGILLRWKCPKTAHYCTKVGSTASLLFIVATIVIQNIVYPGIYINAPWKILLAVFVMPSCGIVLGYCLSWIIRQEMAVRKTIAIESGVQNVAVAMSVLALSPFTFEEQGLLMLFPTLYGISMISLCLVLSGIYRIWKKFSPISSESEVKTEPKNTGEEHQMKHVPQD